MSLSQKESSESSDLDPLAFVQDELVDRDAVRVLEKFISEIHQVRQISLQDLPSYAPDYEQLGSMDQLSLVMCERARQLYKKASDHTFNMLRVAMPELRYRSWDGMAFCLRNPIRAHHYRLAKTLRLLEPDRPEIKELWLRRENRDFRAFLSELMPVLVQLIAPLSDELGFDPDIMKMKEEQLVLIEPNFYQWKDGELFHKSRSSDGQVLYVAELLTALFDVLLMLNEFEFDFLMQNRFAGRIFTESTSVQRLREVLFGVGNKPDQAQKTNEAGSILDDDMDWSVLQRILHFFHVGQKRKPKHTLELTAGQRVITLAIEDYQRLVDSGVIDPYGNVILRNELRNGDEMIRNENDEERGVSGRLSL
jgi:hypothetical protein